MTPEAALQTWLERRLDPAALSWLRQAATMLGSGSGDRELFRAISLVSRMLGKAALALDAAELQAAQDTRPDWDPSTWTIDQAGRVRLLLASAQDGDAFIRRLDPLCATADVDELVAFYRGLPVYPVPTRLRARAAEGLRSNMKVVFEAVALRNPYPAEQLADEAWNQMVLKALFVGSPLHPIVGLDKRANAALARMLGDYARERWAARRPVSPELWRCVGPYATGTLLEDLERVLVTGSASERAAALDALRRAGSPEAQRMLLRHTAPSDRITSSE